MPNHEAIFITQVIKQIVFELASSPHSYGVVSSIYGVLNGIEVDRGILYGSWHKHIGRNIITTLHVDGSTVYFGVETGSIN